MIHKPSSPAARMNDSRNCAQRAERAQVVEVGGGLLGLDLSGRRPSRRIFVPGASPGLGEQPSSGAAGWPAGRAPPRPRPRPSGPGSPSAGMQAPGVKGQLAGNGRGHARRQLERLGVRPGGLERGRIGVRQRRRVLSGAPGRAKRPAASAKGWRRARSPARPENRRRAAP